jgi:hypothetical protein
MVAGFATIANWEDNVFKVWGLIPQLSQMWNKSILYQKDPSS